MKPLLFIVPFTAVGLRLKQTDTILDSDDRLFAGQEILQLADQPDKIFMQSDDNISDEFEESFGSIIKQKNELTTEVREAGITQSDEDLINSFTETMTSSDTNVLADFQPEEKDIDESISKAKKMDAEIFKEHHPAEYAKQLQDKANKLKEQEEYKNQTISRMSDLKSEVNDTILDFMQTAQDL